MSDMNTLYSLDDARAEATRRKRGDIAAHVVMIIGVLGLFLVVGHWTLSL